MGKYSTEEAIIPIGGEGGWEQIPDQLPDTIDLERSAKSTGALRRRRAVKNAKDMLRIVLMYTVCDWSLKTIGMWCVLQGIGDLSAVAIRQRLRGCKNWLGMLVGAILQVHLLDVKYQGGLEGIESQAGFRIRLMDATCISKPGSSGTDWRLHLSMDVGNLRIDGLEITDCHGGESFGRFLTGSNDVRVGDRGYAYAKSMGPVLESGSTVTRIGWQNLPLEDAAGQRIDLIGCMQGLKDATGEWEVFLQTPQGRFQLRLVVAALPQEAADRARQRIHKSYQKKGKTPDQRTLLAAGFIMLVTNLPISSWPVRAVLMLYRVRWQVELIFKRMKSILQLDHLRAFDPDLSQVYLLGKLLAALLTDQFVQTIRARVPAWFTNPNRPVSLCRLTILFFDWLKQTVCGRITPPMILDALPRLDRFLCDTSRKRPSQLVQILVFLASGTRC